MLKWPSQRWTSRLALAVVGCFCFRAACYEVMLWLALYNEGRPAPRLPDLVLDLVPYVEVVDRYNYVVWLVAYLPVALLLLLSDARRFNRYMVSSGLLALLRGVSIVVTGLGPVHGADVHAGQSLATWSHFVTLALPSGFFSESGARVALTKDLFFSGHTATTLLLLLYVWRGRLRWPMLLGHIVVVATVFLSHLHYTIDVLGAYFATLALFAVREGRLDVQRPPS